jgi:hypothetical protein
MKSCKIPRDERPIILRAGKKAIVIYASQTKSKEFKSIKEAKQYKKNLIKELCK